THQYYLARTRRGDKHFIELRKVAEDGITTLGEKEVSPELAAVDLKVDGKGLVYDFSYSDNNGKTWQTVAEGVDAGFTSTAAAGGFTGTVVGPYASSAAR
ncbi:MAG: glycoside hydrolase family 43 protein, partial [Duncaniella sp.]|nr:glycoside hydrolase family 43 protein [Duncaniella sp.]